MKERSGERGNLQEQGAMTARNTFTTLPKRGRPSKYLAIRDWLAARIADGEFGNGAQLPSEHEIMQRFEVSRVTARQAFDDLRRLGLVVSMRGKGYFVRRFTAVHDLLRLQSFGEMMAPLGVTTHSKVIELVEIAAPKEAAEALRLSQNELILRIVRARMAGGTVISLDVSFFPLDIGQKLARLNLVNNDVFLLIEKDLGLELGFAELTIEVVAAPAVYARHIGVHEGDNVLRIRRLTHDDRGRPVDFEHLYARLDAFQFRVRSCRW